MNRAIFVVNNPDNTIPYDLDDVDGKLAMLHPGLSGCVVGVFSKRMDERNYGTVTLNGAELPKGLFFTYSSNNTQYVGFPVRGRVTDYDQSYTMCIEAFVDEEGIPMEAQELTIRTLPRKLPVPGYESHDAVALEAAREGIVLLKNEGNVLPLQIDESLNIFGKGLLQFRVSALGAGKINARYIVGLLRAIEEHSRFSLNPELKALYMLDQDSCPDDETLNRAYALSDTAVLIISRAAGENIDSRPVPGEYYLTAAEEAMIAAVTGKFAKTVAVINSGYPIDIRWAEKYNVKGLLLCGFTGMLGGQALVEILDGRVNPSAKLPDTWSLDYHDIPSSRNFYNAEEGSLRLDGDSPYYVDTFYEEDIYVGYRYFETFEKPVAYPFGFGLSYTTFTLQNTKFLYEKGKISLSVKVANVGQVTGKEVVQVYVEEPDGVLEKPARKLVGFAKTKALVPGEEQELEFEILKGQLTSFNEENASWIMEAGTYTFYSGTSVQHLQQAGCFKIEKTLIIQTVTNQMRPPVEIRTLSKYDPDGTYPTGNHSGIIPGATELTHQANRLRIPEVEPQEALAPSQLIRYSEAVEHPELLDSFVKSLSIEELARLSVSKAAGWGMTETGEAGSLYLLEPYEMEEFTVADGNCGVNVNKPNIGMPSSTTVCSTFNIQIAYEVGKVIAEEATELGIHLILGPGMNIHRNPLNGRHPEYFSEDPYLAGVMAGHHSKGLEDYGVSSCLKHTVANNCETARKRNHSLITERALREIYLKAFEVAMQIHQPDSIMTAYNACNGVYTAEDEEMIQGIFRGEFGFEGYVMTDWNSYETIDIAAAVAAGNCWMTPGSPDDTFVAPIVSGVREGRIDRARLERNVKYLLRIALKHARKSKNHPIK